VAGSQRTFGDELVVSGLKDRISYSIGQFHFETDGFRANNDQRREVVDAFVQASLSHRTSVQAEFRASDADQGDRSLHFFPDDFLQGLRLSSDWRSGRVGFRHAFGPGSDLLGNFSFQRRDSDDHFEIPPILVDDTERVEKSIGGELQFLARSGRGSLVGGVGYFATDLDSSTTTVFSPPGSPPLPPDVKPLEQNVRHTNLYLYAYPRYPQSLTWTIGASADFLSGAIVDRNQFNPKAGVIWNPLPGTAIRAAAFRVLKRLLINDQTLEPTQVAGFNQFFDDPEGTSAWNYGVAVDQKFSPEAYVGMEYAWRNLEVPFPFTDITTTVTTIQQADWREQHGRAYINWAPDDRIALSAEYQYEEIHIDRNLILFEQVKTHRVPLQAAFFHPCGFFARLNGTWYSQEGSFHLQNSPPDAFVQGSDSFWVVNASIGYRLPGRYGILSIEGKNLFDEAFRYQDTDPASPTLQPKRAIFFKATFAL
jgi:outer membrane receptor protein involved in Fe transport